MLLVLLSYALLLQYSGTRLLSRKPISVAASTSSVSYYMPFLIALAPGIQTKFIYRLVQAKKKNPSSDAKLDVYAVC